MMTGNYLIVHAHRVRISQLLFCPRVLRSGVLESSESIRLELNENWKIKLSLILIKLLKIAAVPLAQLGTCIEFLLNLSSQNGGLLKTLFRLLTGDCIDLFISSIPAFHLLKSNKDFILSQHHELGFG